MNLQVTRLAVCREFVQNVQHLVHMPLERCKICKTLLCKEGSCIRAVSFPSLAVRGEDAVPPETLEHVAKLFTLLK